MAFLKRSFFGTQPMKCDQSECFRSGTQCEGILRELQTRLDLCDVVLIADNGKTIPAHRMILIASSKYFSALLTNTMKESREITINEMDGNALENLINFCYTGSLQLNEDTIKVLLTTAQRLQLEKAVEGCCEFLHRHLNRSNCLAVLFLATQLNLDVFFAKTKKFICEHFEEVSNQPDFLLLTSKLLSEFIASDDLNVPSEEFLFEVLMKWIDYEPEIRREYFTELLALVRLPLMSLTFLTERVEKFCDSAERQTLFVTALKSHLQFTNKEFCQPRKKNVAKQLLTVYEEHKIIKLKSYNVRTKKWENWSGSSFKYILSNGKYSPDFTNAILDNNSIIVCGSFNYPMNTVWRINLYTSTAFEMTPMKSIRKEHSVATLKGSIYVMGGYNGHEFLSSVERYDPVSEEWSLVAPMHESRHKFAAAVINDQLYVSGGSNRAGTLNSLECYNPVKNVWTLLAPMKVKRESHALTAYKGDLLAVGGKDSYMVEGFSVERYDYRTNEWKEIKISNEFSGRTKCASLGQHLFIHNNNRIYMTFTDDSCDKLILEEIPTPTFESVNLSLLALPRGADTPRKSKTLNAGTDFTYIGVFVCICCLLICNLKDLY